MTRGVRCRKVLLAGASTSLLAGVLALVIAVAPAGASVSTSWSQVNGADNGCTLHCASSPQGRAASALAYDQATNQLILFGGLGATTSEAGFNDTWAWNGTSWTQVADTADPGCTSTCTNSPPKRAATAMAYDPASHQVILFGGQGTGPYLNDTWAWNGTSWTQVADTGDPGCTTSCTNSPPTRSGDAMAYDPTLGAIVLFGGLTGGNNTWAWNGTTWTQIADTGDPGCTTTCTNSPPSSVAATMAYDQSTSQLVLFGGATYTGNDTWVLSHTTWTQVADTGHPGCVTTCPTSPPGRSGAGMAYDAVLGKVVLFGGLRNGPNHDTNLNDTWAWNGTTWTQIDDTGDPGCTTTCATAPPGRSALPMAYDSGTGDVVVFGGNGNPRYSTNFLNDTWVIGPVPTTTTISVSPSSTTHGQPAIYSAVVASLSGTASGTVSFAVGTTTLCAASLSGGRGSCTAGNAPVGTDVVTGSYSGDAVHAGSEGTATLTVKAAPASGYSMAAADGGIFAFGTAPFLGSMGGKALNASVVGMAKDPSTGGYYEVAADGGIFAFGTAPFLGSMGGKALNAPIVGMAAAPTGNGYYEVASDGGIFAFGTAPFLGSMGGKALNAPIVGMAAAPTGNGYYEVASDGGIFAFGTAPFLGSMGGKRLNAPVVGMAEAPTGNGYYEVAADGGIFAFGTAPFLGSMGGKALDAPIVGMAATPTGKGYWEVAADGGIFTFGTAAYDGSMAGRALNAPVVGMAAS